MASRSLGQAARRLAQQQWRGLANALAEGASGSSVGASKQQAMSAVALRAYSSQGGGSSSSSGGLTSLAAESLKETSATSQNQQHQQQAGASSSAAPAAAAAAVEGGTDFSRKELVMLFTCGKCNTRAAKAFSKRSYTHGVVIVDCPGCHSKHLIADHLGWFGQKGTVEEFAAEKGNLVMRKLADGTTELSPEDILGSSLMAQQAQQAEAAGQEAGAAGPGGEKAAAAARR